jgi:hypothetical protein
MRISVELQSKIAAHQKVQRLLSPWVQALPAGLAAGLLLFALQPVAAQALATPSPSAATQRPVHHRKHPTAGHPLIAPAQAGPVPGTPPASERPNWPANDHPAKASVSWDSQGLRIDAENSSLLQILKDFSVAAGTKVEGLGADERIFGIYGPGQARDVLSQLLLDSGYNVLMIGDQGQGTPRQVLLSARHPGDTQPAANSSQAASSDEDTDAEEPPPPQPQQPPPVLIRPGFTPGGPPRTPQQIMQEMQQRQQQMQQQQQQTQQPNNPQN